MDAPYSGLQPYGNHVSPLINLREREQTELADALAKRGAIVELVGPPGVGKTSLVNTLARANSHLFPGGFEFFSGSRAFQLSEAEQALADSFNPGAGHTLLIVDDADALNPNDLATTVRRLSTGPWSFSTLLVARRPVGLSDRTIPLEPLDVAAIQRLLASIFADGFDESKFAELARATRGLPLLAKLLADLVRHGNSSPDELAGFLQPFEQPGLIDLAGQPLTRKSAAAKKIIVDVGAVNDDFLRRAADDPQFLYKISPRQFEELVAELLARKGYRVELTQQSRDGGKDIYAAKRDDLGQFLYLVECKHYAPDRPVGVEVVRALHGVADIERVTGSMIVTTSHFSRAARELASEIRYRMSLKEYLDVRAWLAQFRPKQF